MKLSSFSVSRPVTMIMLLLSIMIIGGIAITRIPLAFLPEIDAPFIGVQIAYPNSNPWQVEREIVKPVEELLATLPNVRKLRSTANADSAEFQMEFDWGFDVDIIRMQVSEKMDQIRPSLSGGDRPDPDLLVQHERHSGGRRARRIRGRGSVAELRRDRGADPQSAAPCPRRGARGPERGRAPGDQRRSDHRQGEGAQRRHRRVDSEAAGRVVESRPRPGGRKGDALHRPRGGRVRVRRRDQAT